MSDVEYLQARIHGYDVRYSDDTRAGMDYLKNDLNSDEAEVIFEYAKRHNTAPFEDDHNRDFLLIHDDGNDYHIERR